MDDAEIEEEERKSNTDKKVHNFFFAFLNIRVILLANFDHHVPAMLLCKRSSGQQILYSSFSPCCWSLEEDFEYFLFGNINGILPMCVSSTILIAFWYARTTIGELLNIIRFVFQGCSSCAQRTELEEKKPKHNFFLSYKVSPGVQQKRNTAIFWASPWRLEA